jgi:hypothetical protein
MLDLVAKFLRDRSASHLGTGTIPGPGESEMYSHPDDAHEKTGLVPPLLIALILSLLVLSHLNAAGR